MPDQNLTLPLYGYEWWWLGSVKYLTTKCAVEFHRKKVKKKKKDTKNTEISWTKKNWKEIKENKIIIRYKRIGAGCKKKTCTKRLDKLNIILLRRVFNYKLFLWNLRAQKWAKIKKNWQNMFYQQSKSNNKPTK